MSSPFYLMETINTIWLQLMGQGTWLAASLMIPVRLPDQIAGLIALSYIDGKVVRLSEILH